jgi:outer membrane receptor for ferrienterochelin and colicins
MVFFWVLLSSVTLPFGIFSGDTLIVKKPNADTALYHSNTTLEEVVVTGSLRQVSRLESPVPIESYPSAYFKRTCTNNLFDAVGLINGVQPQITCNVCNTGGLQINGLEGPYTMVLIDGLPVMSALATVYGLFGIPNSIIKRVEVVKGPSSTLFGSEAVAGVINIITKAPQGENELTFGQTFTSYKEHNTDLAYTFQKRKFSGLMSLNHFQYKNPVDRNGDVFMDVPLILRSSFFSRLIWDRKSGMQFSIALRYISEDRSGGEMRWTRKWRGSDSVYGESIATRRFELFGNYSFNAGSEKLLLEFAINNHFQDSWYGNTFYQASQQGAFTQLRWNKQIGSHYLTAGIPVRYQNYDDNSVATQDYNTVKSLPSRNGLVGLFVQDEWKLSSLNTTLFGLRFEQHNLHGSVWSPRFSFKWDIPKNQTFRFTAGNGFRVVNLFTEDHAAITGARRVLIEETLRPERSWNFNLNYAAQYKNVNSGLIDLEVGLFHTVFTNRILPDYDSDPEKIIYTNLNGRVISRGANASVSANLKSGFFLQTGLTFLDVYKTETEVSKKRLPYVPALSLNYGLSYQWDDKNLLVDLTARTLSPMRMPIFPNDFRPALSPWYSIFNAQVTKKIRNEIELVFGVQNILNFLPEDPIMRPFDPFDKTVNDPVNNPNGYTFDPSYNYAPMLGRRFNIGANFKLRGK